jgi:hypothetical protein
MKKLIIIFLAAIGISYLTSCEEEPKDPVLDLAQRRSFQGLLPRQRALLSSLSRKKQAMS